MIGSQAVMEMKWKSALVLVFVAFGGALGLAQLAPDAAQLLDKMRVAHGKEALTNLKTYQETSTVTLFSGPHPAGQVTVVTYFDFSSRQLRVDYKVGNNLVQMILVSPAGGQSWSKDTGVVALEPPRLRDFLNSFYSGWLGLRLDGTEWEHGQLLGTQTFGDVTGRAIVLSTRGSKTTYLVNEQNQLIAEQTQTSTGLMTGLYYDLRPVSGILIPFRGRIFANGVLFAEVEVLEARVNPVLRPETFKLP